MAKSSAIEALEVALVAVTLGLAGGASTEALAGAGVALLLTVASRSKSAWLFIDRA